VLTRALSPHSTEQRDVPNESFTQLCVAIFCGSEEQRERQR